MSKSDFWKLGLILLLALALRLYHLSTVPVGFHGDEASIGYNAFSLLKTLKDQNGKFLPLAIDQFGDFRPAGYHYLAIPFIAVFGLTETATRLPAALFGALTVIPLYFVVWQLFRNKSLSLLSGLLLVISPWHITVSRATSESVIALFLVLWGGYVLLRSDGKDRRFILYAALFFTASFFFYHAARIFVPLFVLGYATVLFFLKRVKESRVMFLFALVMLGLSLLIFFLSNGLGRVGQVSILGAPGEQVDLRQQIAEDRASNPWVTRFLHNKVTYYAWGIADNYLLHFSGKFLFLEGGQPVRYRVPWIGVMYMADMIFFALGAAFLISWITRAKQPQSGYVIFVWLLLAPIPAALTFSELPSVQRAIFMIPALLILVAYGFIFFTQLFSRAWKKVVYVLIILVYGYQIIVFGHNYFYHSFTHEPWYRNAAEKELVTAVASYTNQGKKVIMTSQNDNNLIFYLFYLRFDPKKFQQLGSPRDKDNLVFGNMIFIYKHCPLEGSEQDKALGEPGVIYVNRAECKVPVNSIVLKEISWPDETLAFRILMLKEQ